MPHDIRIPRLGWSMDEGVFVGWLKQSGDAVAAGEALYEMESDKALQQIESLDAGTLFIPPDAPTPGATVAVGALLGYLLAAGEKVPTRAASTQPQIVVAPRETPAQRQPEVRTAARPLATPRARRIAAELGVEWESVTGTGRGGRIREADVRAAISTSHAAVASASTEVRGVPLSPRRKAIAERLRRSYALTVPVTLTATADATSLVAVREKYRVAAADNDGVVPSYTDLIAFLAARTLGSHPRMAVRWLAGGNALLPLAESDLHVAIAVDTPDGLMAPVVRDAARKSVLEIARESRDSIDRARRGRLAAADQQGAAITITNLGGYGIDAFTPVIDYPQIAILGLGAIRLQPTCTPDGRIEPRRQITLSLTVDHAAIDGAPAAAFLRDLVAHIEDATAYAC